MGVYTLRERKVEMKRIIFFIRLIFIPWVIMVYDCCENNWHDYPIDRGGNGFPEHFHSYTCWYCGKTFEI